MSRIYLAPGLLFAYAQFGRRLQQCGSLWHGGNKAQHPMLWLRVPVARGAMAPLKRGKDDLKDVEMLTNHGFSYKNLRKNLIKSYHKKV